MIRSHSKQTPWINFQEWSSVRCLLLPYSVTEAARIRRGLARVSTWSCRGRVPLSVQITAQLLRIRLSDDVDPMRDPDVLRLAYGMALVRLVNGIVEPEQRTKTYASSVADTAERLGLPRWFVDIRHDATHTNLPSLSTLRMACKVFVVAFMHRIFLSIKKIVFNAVSMMSYSFTSLTTPFSFSFFLLLRCRYSSSIFSNIFRWMGIFKIASNVVVVVHTDNDDVFNNKRTLFSLFGYVW